MGINLYQSSDVAAELANIHIRYSLVISDQKWKFYNFTISGGYCTFNIHVYVYA